MKKRAVIPHKNNKGCIGNFGIVPRSKRCVS